MLLLFAKYPLHGSRALSSPRGGRVADERIDNVQAKENDMYTHKQRPADDESTRRPENVPDGRYGGASAPVLRRWAWVGVVCASLTAWGLVLALVFLALCRG